MAPTQTFPVRYLTQSELRAELRVAAKEILAKPPRKPYRPNRVFVPGKTRRWVYVIRPGGPLVKVGIATNVKSRRKELQTASAQRLTIHHKVLCEPGTEHFVESAVHQAMRSHRQMGEWFSVDPEYAAAILDQQHKRLSRAA